MAAIKEVTSHEQSSSLGTGPLCAALSGLLAILTVNPGLTPWAFLSRPFGANIVQETIKVPFVTVKVLHANNRVLDH